MTLFSTVADLPDIMIQPIADYLSKIVILNNEASNQKKLILIACTDPKERTCGTVRLLLKFGAVPDATTVEGDGPLHILAYGNGEFTESIARVLLDAGAHLDRKNKVGLTAADTWIEYMKWENKMRRREYQQPCGWRDLPDWLQEGVPKLQCLSARIIRSHRISYKDKLSPLLHPFVALH